MSEIEIKRGYEVLPDNNVRFGIRVINTSNLAISDVEVILDYNESLFSLEGNKIQKLGTIPPTVPRTAKFILKPLGCVHKEQIGATVIYKDPQWKKHTEEMRPKEVHCVCPFMREKAITRADFLKLSSAGHFEERGVNFEGVNSEKMVSFLAHTCKNRLYKVDEFSIENGKILYLAGDAVGDKAYYLLTAVVKDYEGLTQVLLRANSDKNYGLNGFLNEIMDNLRHLVLSANAKEIGIIKKEQVINIIDSVVQRTSFSASDTTPSVNIQGSVLQRTEIKEDLEKKRLEEERLRNQQEERMQMEERQKVFERQRREEEERQARQIAEMREKERQNAVVGELLKKQNEPIMTKIAPVAPVPKKGGRIIKGLVVIAGLVAITVILAAVIAAFVFGLGGTQGAAPTASIVVSNNPDTTAPTASIVAANNPDSPVPDMKIQHKGGDLLKGGKWKLSIVDVGNPPNFITSTAGSDFVVGNEIISATTTNGATYLTNSAVNGNVKLISGNKYDVKLVHIPSNAMLLDQVVEVR